MRTQGEKMTEWFENDQFWSTWYPYMFDQERFDRAEAEVDQLLALLATDGGSVLDMACGPGRHAIELAKRDFKVTGVDRSPFLLSKAKERAEAAKVEVEWVEEDMRSFQRPGAFDLAINMYTAFGYFDDKSEDLRVLKQLHGSLVTGGALVIDVVGKEWLARHFEPTSSTKHEDGSLMINRREIFDDWTRIRNEWILLRGGDVQTFEFHHTVYSGQELRDRLEDAGFESVRLYGDLDGNPYGPDAKRLIAVGRK
jgi:SAM-dependent methyltransferase